jgi:anti-sigma factor RsiW
MIHLSDETLNEYIDHALSPELQAGAEAHLAACPQCAGRLGELQALVADLIALPELALGYDLAPTVVIQIEKQAARLPRWVQWLAWMQAAAILLAVGLTWPLLAPLLPATAVASFPTPQEWAYSLWANFTTQLAHTAQLSLPAFSMPEVDLPVATLAFFAAGLSLLWLLGNGLFLLPRFRRSS